MMKKLLLILFLLLSLGVSYAQTKDSLNTTTLSFNINTDSLIINDSYRQFNESVVPYILSNKDNLKWIKIISSSSPDGSEVNNKYLSDKRLAKIKSLLPEDVHSYITSESISENYDELYSLLYNSNETYRDQVLYLISNGNNIKNGLKSINGGLVWNDMKIKYFPQLRSAKISICSNLNNSCPVQLDTIYLVKTDTLYLHKVDTQYVDIRKTWKKYPIISLKTNALLDIIPYSPFGLSFTPNVQVEVYTLLHGLSLEFEYTFPWWKNDNTYKYYQIINGCFGIRKYFDNAYRGWYVGLYGNTGYFDLSINKDKGWQGEHHGVGLSVGYVIRRGVLRFEPYIRVGWVGGKYDSYHAGDPFNGRYYYDWYKPASEFEPRKYTFNYFGPTMIGFNISFDIINIRKP